MLKRVATTLVIAVIVGGTAMAGDAKLGGVARQISMGGAGGMGIAANPFVFDDPVYQYINPAYQGLYRDYAWANVGGTTGTYSATTDGYGLQDGGANFSLGQGWTLGTILAHDHSAIAGGFAGALSLSPVEVVEAVGSYGFGQTIIGLAATYGWTSADFTTSAGKPEASVTEVGFRGGVHHDIGGGCAIEGSVGFTSSSATGKNPTLTPPFNADASGTEFVVAGRYKHHVNNKVNLIIPAAFITGKADGTLLESSGLKEVTATGFAIGVGADVTVGDFYMAGGVSFATQNTKVTQTSPADTVSETTETAIPTINIGSEYRFTDWLTGRVGYFRAIVNQNNKATPTPVSGISESNMTFGTSTVFVGPYTDDNLIVLGLAMNFGMVGIEATVSEAALRSGLGLIGNTGLNTFGYMTMNVNFE